MLLVNCFLLSYVILLLYVMFVNSSDEKSKEMNLPDIHSLSVEVLIPFRNEGERIERLIQSVLIQKTKYKVIYRFLNDHSEDVSEKIVFKYIDQNLPIVLESYKNIYGKKDVLNYAIKNSAADVILTTDADCILPIDWVESMVNTLVLQKADMVVGQVKISNNHFFESLQSLEFISIQAITKFLFKINKPLLANGANLGFKKNSFNEIGGYESHLNKPSGDDIYLLKSMIQHKKKICYVNNTKAAVLTSPVFNLNEFIHQRIRWASKIQIDIFSLEFIFAGFIFMFQVLAIIMIVLAIKTGDLYYFSWLVGKLIIDYFFLLKSSQILSDYFKLTTFIVLFLMYPIYIIVIALLSRNNKYRWKNRMY